MTLEEFGKEILARYDAEHDHTFEGDPSVNVYKRPDTKKWFAVTKNIGRRYLGLEGSGRIDILNVKLGSRLAASLRKQEGFMPGWRMDQDRWVTILLDGTVPDEEIWSYVDMSYEIASKAKGRRK